MLDLLFLTSCAVTTTITTPDEQVYVVKSERDAMVEFHQGDIKVIVDNRGRPGMVEQALGIMFMNLPQVEIGTD